MNENIYRIAGNKTNDNWVSFRKELVVGNTEEKWKKAFDEFYCPRLKIRYLDPVEVLREKGENIGEGFKRKLDNL